MSDATEFKNENLTVSIERDAGAKVKLEIRISPKATHAAYQKALKEINKEVSLPGFRKGRAPDQMILQNYGQYVEKEWREILIRTAFSEALDLIKIYPFSEDSIQRPQIKDVSLENGATFTVEFESAPEVPAINLEDFQIQKTAPETVMDKHIEDIIQEIRLHYAEWQNVTDRPVQEGDYVEIDIDRLDPLPELNICKNSRFQVAAGKMANWMRTLLIGKHVNETAEGISEKEPHGECEGCEDPSHNHSEAEFIPTRCKITLNTIQTAALPEVDDALAVKTGLKTAEELRARIRSDLEKQAENKAQAEMRAQFDSIALSKYVFDLPASLIKAETQARIADAKAAMEQENLSKEEKNEKYKALTEQTLRDVERAFRLYFITRKIAEENHIQVAQDEVMMEFMRQMFQSGYNPSMMKDEKQAQEIRARIYTYLLGNKAKDFVINRSLQHK